MSVGFVKREQLLLCISYLSRLWRFCQKVLRPVMPHLRIKVNSSSVSALKVKGRVTLKPPSKGKGLHKGLAGSEKESQGLPLQLKPLQLQLAFKEGEGKKRKFLHRKQNKHFCSNTNKLYPQGTGNAWLEGNSPVPIARGTQTRFSFLPLASTDSYLKKETPNKVIRSQIITFLKGPDMGHSPIPYHVPN